MRTMLPCLSVYMLLVLCLSDVQNILVPLQLNYVPCNEFLVPMYTTSVSASSVILIVVSCKSKMTIFLFCFFLSLRLVDFLACLNVAPRRPLLLYCVHHATYEDCYRFTMFAITETVILKCTYYLQ